MAVMALVICLTMNDSRANKMYQHANASMRGDCAFYTLAVPKWHNDKRGASPFSSLPSCPNNPVIFASAIHPNDPAGPKDAMNPPNNHRQSPTIIHAHHAS
jgi:hypothetical protein